MPKEPKVTVPDMIEGAERLRDVVKPLGTLFVQTPRGEVEANEGPGILSMMLTSDRREPAIILLIYDPAPCAELDGRGMGMVHQMSAASARSIGASLIGMANQLDPQRPN